MVILRPQWVANLLSSIVTTKHRLVNRQLGMVDHDVLIHQIWSDEKQFPRQWHSQMIDLLIKLQIIYPDRRGQLDGIPRRYFIPCMLPEEAPDLRFFRENGAGVLLERAFHLTECQVVPIHVVPLMLIELFRLGEFQTCWQQGAIIRIDQSDQSPVQCLLTVSQMRSILVSVSAPNRGLASEWIRKLSTLVSNHLLHHHFLSFDVRILCPSGPSCFIPMSSLDEDIIKEMRFTRCLPSQAHHSLIESLAPDRVFADFVGRLTLSWSDLEFVRELGRGAFGRVLEYSRVSSATPLAIKLLEIKADEKVPESNVYSEFHHEVYLMSLLDHPNVVRLLGICSQPLGIAMEIVRGGDLLTQLIDPFKFSATMTAFTDFLKPLLGTLQVALMKFDSLPGLWLMTNRLQEFSPTDRARLEEICHNFFQDHIEDYVISPESLARQLRKCDQLER